MRPDFPEVIDSTMLAAAKRCLRKAELEFFECWRPKDLSVHLHAGASYAAGLEAARTAYYVQGRPPAEAIAMGAGVLLTAYGDFECPPESAKSAERTLGALEFYFDRYPLGSDRAIPISLPGGKRGIEFSFCEPIDLHHPQTGNPLLIAGRMDMLCDYQNLVLGEDDKTTSQLGPTWSRQWDLRSQFTCYVWGAKRAANLTLNGFIVRGVSILKRSYDTQEAITYRPDWQVDRWYKQTIRDIRRMILAWNEGYFDYDLDTACTDYGGCTFRNACLMSDPMPLLEQQFERRRWDPVRRVEVPMEVRDDRLVEKEEE